MTIREAVIVVLGTALLFVALLGGAFLLLETDFSALRAQPTDLDCADPNSKLCRLRNFFEARSEQSGEKQTCIRYGLPADCTDL